MVEMIILGCQAVLWVCAAVWGIIFTWTLVVGR